MPCKIHIGCLKCGPPWLLSHHNPSELYLCFSAFCIDHIVNYLQKLNKTMCFWHFMYYIIWVCCVIIWGSLWSLCEIFVDFFLLRDEKKTVGFSKHRTCLLKRQPHRSSLSDAVLRQLTCCGLYVDSCGSIRVRKWSLTRTRHRRTKQSQCRWRKCLKQWSGTTYTWRTLSHSHCCISH